MKERYSIGVRGVGLAVFLGAAGAVPAENLVAPQLLASPTVVYRRDTEVEMIARRCGASASAGFERVFAEACVPECRPGGIFGGLILWVYRGGQPVLQGRADLALHFIYGAACEASGGMGWGAAVFKEQMDRAHGGPFDVDDMAASVTGAEWVRRAKADPHWIEQWRSGEKTLEKNLPRFRYGTGKYSQELAARVCEDVTAALDR